MRAVACIDDLRAAAQRRRARMIFIPAVAKFDRRVLPPGNLLSGAVQPCPVHA